MSSADANKFIQKVNIVKVDASGNIIEGSNIPLGDYTYSFMTYSASLATYVAHLVAGATLDVADAFTFVGETDFSKKFYPYRLYGQLIHVINPANPDDEVSPGLIQQKDNLWLNIVGMLGAEVYYDSLLRREDFAFNVGGWMANFNIIFPHLIGLAKTDQLLINSVEEFSRSLTSASIALNVYGFII